MSRDIPWTCPICRQQPCTCTPDGARALPTLACRCGRTMRPVDMHWLPKRWEPSGLVARIVCTVCASARAATLRRLARDAVGATMAAAVVVGLGLLYELAPVVVR